MNNGRAKSSSSSRYDAAVSALYAQISRSMEVENRERTVLEMREYMRRLGLEYRRSEVKFKVVHVTGTKGKGSTCAFTENIIRRVHGRRTGMFTSPHLLKVNERIRLDGKPICDNEFADTYFLVRELLLRASETCENNQFKGLPSLPGYFRMLTLMSIFVFTHHVSSNGLYHGVDVVILEVGIGGRYDATNVYDFHDACGISKLDLDHTNLLGNTLEKIAWEKGGIIKRNESFSLPRSFSVDCNCDESLTVLRNCAYEAQGNLLIIEVGRRIKLGEGWLLGLKGDHQIVNAELALALSESVMGYDSCHITLNNEEYVKRVKEALKGTTWPARCQRLDIDYISHSLQFFIDGAHTLESIKCSLQWFRACVDTSLSQVLIFNCGHDRNPIPLLQQIQSQFNGGRFIFGSVFFCKPKWERSSANELPSIQSMLPESKYGEVQLDKEIETSWIDGSWQQRLAILWKVLASNGRMHSEACAVYCCENMNEMLEKLKDKSSTKAVQICVVGSLYLAGSVLDLVGYSETLSDGHIKYNS